MIWLYYLVIHLFTSCCLVCAILITNNASAVLIVAQGIIMLTANLMYYKYLIYCVMWNYFFVVLNLLRGKTNIVNNFINSSMRSSYLFFTCLLLFSFRRFKFSVSRHSFSCLEFFSIFSVDLLLWLLEILFQNDYI